MATEKKITENDLITWFMDYVLENDRQPSTVYSFAKNYHFEEASFYKYFGSFQAVEKAIFEAFFKQATDLLEKNKDYEKFDAKNKLLSFYYTFFEILTANRSYVLRALESDNKQLKSVRALSKLKRVFSAYIEGLHIEPIGFKEDRLEKIQNRGIKETAWFQLLVTIKFWLDDTSASFEKTDIFIEKSVNASFDLIDTTRLKSLVDFGKFFFKEKICTN